jgi:hypothetical protein
MLKPARQFPCRAFEKQQFKSGSTLEHRVPGWGNRREARLYAPHNTEVTGTVNRD